MSQWPNAGKFLARARVHQRRWVFSALGVVPDHTERVLIPEELARAGRNFIPMPVVQQAVRSRYPRFRGPLVADALRSQHIPFNLFGPLKAILHSENAVRFWGAVVDRELSSLESLDFETAPTPARDYLGDGTCFDVFIRARDARGRLILYGVEVKYTEGAYSWGTTERMQMNDPHSCYSKLTASLGWFVDGARERLANKHLKQLWRNQLLAAAAHETDADKPEAVMVHLFPAGNAYQAEAAKRFAECLSPGVGSTFFCPATYEAFFMAARSHLSPAQDEWINYCCDRYLVADSVARVP